MYTVSHPHISTQATHLPEKKNLCSLQHLKNTFLKNNYYKLQSGKGPLFAQRGMKGLHSTSRQAFNLIYTPLHDRIIGVIQALLDQKFLHLTHGQYIGRDGLHVHTREHVHVCLYIYPQHCVAELREPRTNIRTRSHWDPLSSHTTDMTSRIHITFLNSVDKPLLQIVLLVMTVIM